MTNNRRPDPAPEKAEPELQWVESRVNRVLRAIWPLLALAALYVLYRGIVTAHS